MSLVYLIVLGRNSCIFCGIQFYKIGGSQHVRAGSALLTHLICMFLRYLRKQGLRGKFIVVVCNGFGTFPKSHFAKGLEKAKMFIVVE